MSTQTYTAEQVQTLLNFVEPLATSKRNKQSFEKARSWYLAASLVPERAQTYYGYANKLLGGILRQQKANGITSLAASVLEQRRMIFQLEEQFKQDKVRLLEMMEKIGQSTVEIPFIGTCCYIPAAQREQLDGVAAINLLKSQGIDPPMNTIKINSYVKVSPAK